MAQYQEDLHFPTLTDKYRSLIDSDISLEELTEALKKEASRLFHTLSISELLLVESGKMLDLNVWPLITTFKDKFKVWGGGGLPLSVCWPHKSGKNGSAT